MIKNKKQNKNPNKQKKVKKKNNSLVQINQATAFKKLQSNWKDCTKKKYSESQETLHLAFNNFSKHKFRNSSYYHFQEVYP